MERQKGKLNHQTADVQLNSFCLDSASCQNKTCYLTSKVPANTSTLHFHGIREKQPDGSGSWGVGGPWSDGVPLVARCLAPASSNFTYTMHHITMLLLAPTGTTVMWEGKG